MAALSRDVWTARRHLYIARAGGVKNLFNNINEKFSNGDMDTCVQNLREAILPRQNSKVDLKALKANRIKIGKF